MTPFYIIGIILLCIIALFVLVFTVAIFVKVNFIISYLSSDFYVAVKIFGKEIVIFPKSKEKKSTIKEEKKIGNEAEKQAEQEIKKLESEKFTVEDIFELIKLCFYSLKKLGKKVVIKLIYSDIIIKCDDAADTAILYGKICSAAYPLLGAVDNTLEIKKRDINIMPGFDENICAKYDMKLVVYIKIGSVLYAGIQTYFKLRKNKQLKNKLFNKVKEV